MGDWCNGTNHHDWRGGRPQVYVQGGKESLSTSCQVDSIDSAKYPPKFIIPLALRQARSDRDNITIYVKDQAVVQCQGQGELGGSDIGYVFNEDKMVPSVIAFASSSQARQNMEAARSGLFSELTAVAALEYFDNTEMDPNAKKQGIWEHVVEYAQHFDNSNPSNQNFTHQLTEWLSMRSLYNQDPADGTVVSSPRCTSADLLTVVDNL